MLRLFLHLCDPGAGVAGVAQAGASVADTAMTDATNLMLQQRANEFNASQAQAQRSFEGRITNVQDAFNAQQAQLNRQFQSGQQVQAEQYNTQMSNTAEQRRVADLRAAGLNPLLSIAGLGAASAPQMAGMSGSTASGGIPGGATAQQVGLPDVRGLASGLSGALTAGRQQDLLKAQQEGVTLDNQRKTAELPYAAAQAASAVSNIQAQTKELLNKAMSLSADYNLSQANALKVTQDREFQAQMFPLLMQAQELEIQRKKYGMPELAAEANFWNSSLAAGIMAGQQGAKVGVGGGWLSSLLEAFRRTVQPSGAPAGSGGTDIQAPQF